VPWAPGPENEETQMSKPKSAAALAAFMVPMAVLAATPAAAEERLCRSSLGKVTVDNLKVPQNATCRLDGTRVKGSIVVETGATLVASKVVVIGNVQAEGAKAVTVRRASRVGGSVQVKQGGAATIESSTVDGSIQLEQNGRPMKVAGNTVGADVQAFQNNGGVTIEANVVDGNLQCKENTPAPVGGGNTVQGSKEDQCRKL
jgi:DUF4097 and DUF4098 domain-containing protein YvlB